MQVEESRPRRWGRAAAAHASYADFYQASAYSNFRHETRRAGSLGTQLLQVSQAAPGLTDRATPDLLIGVRLRVGHAPARYDLGDGWIDIPTNRPHIVVAPPLTDVDYVIEGASELVILAAPMQRLAGAVERVDLTERLAPVYDAPFVDPLVTALARRAWLEAGRGDGLVVDSAMVATLSIMLAAAEARHGRPTSPGRPYDLRFTRVVDYIDAHLADDITLSALAAVACLSPYHFARAFKARHGVSPVRFVQGRRVERAKRLLALREVRLVDVAHQCGFADQAHFSTVFRRLTGVTPGAWRAAQGL